MRPRVFGALALASLCVWATPAAADGPQQNRTQQGRETMRFRAMDANGDGRISRREWRGSAQSFRVHDWNGDGVLSGEEVRPGAMRRTDDDYDPQRSRQYTDWTAEAFADLDHNRDGRLTRDEWHYDTESWLRADRNRDDVLTRREFLGEATSDTDREDRFEYLDVNNNGRIERSEWHGTRDTFDWLDVNNDGTLSRREVVGEEANTDADLFASLDYNRDGRLSQDEWHWSRRSFLQQDSNRDGVVSREEFTSPDSEPVGTTGRTARRGVPMTIVVNANQRWIDTGIDLQAGENIVVESEGTVRLSENSSDTSSAAGAGRRAANAPMPNHPAGALIARVGNGSPIFLGDSAGARNVTTGGRLYLGVNDDHLADNAGQFRVTVTVRR